MNNEEEKSGEIPIFDVWDRYENIAMHFNDLLIKLRTQAIAGVAAITTILAIVTKAVGIGELTWEIIAGVFFFLSLFWVAVWILDFKYYNRLLIGAVDALLEIEDLSKKQSYVKSLNLSHKVEEAVAGENIKKNVYLHKKLSFGRKWFYLIVFAGLITGFMFSGYKVFCTTSVSNNQINQDAQLNARH